MDEWGSGENKSARHKGVFTSATHLWLSLLAFLGVGLLPCPECGSPMILHIWPLAGIVAMVQALRRYYRLKKERQG